MVATVKADSTSMREVAAALAGIRNGAKLAMVKALNHTATEHRRDTAAEIYRDVRLGKRYITDKLKIRKARFNRLQASVETPAQGLQLSRYGAQPLKRGGVSVHVKRSGSRRRLPGAFLVTFKNGTKGVYIRTGPGKWGSFENTELLYGPSVSQVYDMERDELMPPSMNRLMARMAYEADELLRRQRAGVL